MYEVLHFALLILFSPKTNAVVTPVELQHFYTTFSF